LDLSEYVLEKGLLECFSTNCWATNKKLLPTPGDLEPLEPANPHLICRAASGNWGPAAVSSKGASLEFITFRSRLNLDFSSIWQSWKASKADSELRRTVMSFIKERIMAVGVTLKYTRIWRNSPKIKIVF